MFHACGSKPTNRPGTETAAILWLQEYVQIIFQFMMMDLDSIDDDGDDDDDDDCDALMHGCKP